MKQSSIIFCSIFLLATTACQKHSEWKSYSGDRNIERRVDSVLSLMTLEEKIGQMNQFSANWDITGPVMTDDFEPYLKKGLVGSLFNVYTVDGVRKMQEMALSESRLKIPVLFGFDVIHGYRTIFPMPLAESCSWDLALMEKTAHIAAVEASASGINWTFAPMVDITRDARWGRVMEGAGEDTYLGSLIATARVNGFQGGANGKNLGATDAILACAKHFAAYGAAEAGRDYNTVIMGDRTLDEVYLPPFKAAKDAGVATFMAAFNEISGIPCTGSEKLMTNVLRDKWDFRGFVVTDYTGINELVPHGFAKDELMAGEKAANAGIDMDMTGAVFIKYLKQSVEEGKVSEKTIDNAVRRILEMKFILGLFDDPYKFLDSEREKNNIMTPEFLQTAREAVQRSTVLLKNERNLFPIDPTKAQTVALIGPMIKEQESLNGEWAGKGVRSESITLYEGLMERYKNTPVNFVYAKGCDLTTNDQSKFAEAISAAQRADVVLVAMGEDFNYSGEAASRSDIKLPGVQQNLLMALKKTGKPIGLILMNGRPLDLSWEDAHIDAILEAWYPGTMAGYGLADIISGDYNPSGRLTMSFPRNIGQVPIYYNHKPTGRPVDPQNPYIDYKSSYLDVPVTPLYPFGHGLSYTSFKIDNLKLDRTTLKKGEVLTATANVTNTGKRDGEIVVQFYIRDVWASVTRPVKELKGFEKITLKAGERKPVTFSLTPEDLAFYNLDMKFEPETGDFKLWIGISSEDESNEAQFTYTE